ncbi:hypothetical protein DFJ74DRAFT_697463 [Hyaloraphidium curvatum]|nr:hypothetical protein DFJ74DRAFT_697463 [Hyaloraphidium curvatum]
MTRRSARQARRAAGPLLPPELLSAIAALLAKTGNRATLARFLRCSRDCYLLGLPELLRRLSLDWFEQRNGDALLRAFLADRVPNTFWNKFSLVKTLEVFERVPLAVLKRLLPKCTACTHLLLGSAAASYTRAAWPLIPASVTRLELYLYRDACAPFRDLDLPPSVTDVRLSCNPLGVEVDTRAHVDLTYAMLERAAGLDALHLLSLAAELPDFARYPRAASKLRRIALGAVQLRVLDALPEGSLRELELTGCDARAWTAAAKFTRLERVEVGFQPTAAVLDAGGLKRGVGELRLLGMRPSVAPADFPRVREALDPGKFPRVLFEKLRHSPLWGPDPWRSPEGAEEEAFWRSLPNVLWIDH